MEERDRDFRNFIETLYGKWFAASVPGASRSLTDAWAGPEHEKKSNFPGHHSKNF